ncbi:unnamed protein product [Nippostrongylus brasiliensis]|uniref:Growth arrest-specific protein 1 homolog (inferred by orthology to a C. elegans protein) n=1 Tax=Nippostrongylus brasiliensis TaxID=27835 RepID=A0A158R0J4_NIPBR|nr:unnamed protein product [Nippostrongylus brasiliensis]
MSRVHRLSPSFIIFAFIVEIFGSTNTCQPQCRNAVLNVYQNKLGRTLLRSDASCIPGREELKTCHFLPSAPVVHCSLAKLACEADLQVIMVDIDCVMCSPSIFSAAVFPITECNSKWGVFVSECEAESARGECSPRCYGLLAEAVLTPYGQPTPPPPAPGDNSITSAPGDNNGDISSSSSEHILLPSMLLCGLLAAQLLLSII